MSQDDKREKTSGLDDSTRSALRSFTASAAAGATMVQMSQGNFVPLFLGRMGFSPLLIGLLSASVRLTAVCQIWSARYMDRRGCKKLMLRAWTIGPLLLIPVIVAPQLGAWSAEGVAVACVFFGLTAFAVSNFTGLAGWRPLLRQNLPLSRSAGLIGKIILDSMLLTVVATFAFSIFLGREPAVWRFQVLYVVAAALGVVRVLSVRRVRDVETPGEEEALSLGKDLGKIWRDLPFRRLVIFVAITWMSIGMIIPFRPLYFETLGFSPRFTAIITVSVNLAAFGLGMRVWGRLADRYGSRSLFVLGGIGVTLGPLLMILPRRNSVLDGAFLVLAMIVGPASWGGYEAGCIRRAFTIVPKRNQSLYMVTYGITGFVCMALGSCLGGILIEAARQFLPEVPGAGRFAIGLDIRLVFVAAMALNVVAIGYSRRMRHLKEMSTPRMLLRLRLRTLRWFLSGRIGSYRRLRRKRDEEP